VWRSRYVDSDPIQARDAIDGTIEQAGRMNRISRQTARRPARHGWRA